MKSPVLALMREYGVEPTRENYLLFNYCGEPPAELSAEEEAELPRQLQIDFLEEAEIRFLERHVTKPSAAL